MTTGSYVHNFGTIPPGPCGGGSYSAFSRSKSWSGGDRTSQGDTTPHPYAMTLGEKTEGIVKHIPTGSLSAMTPCFGGAWVNPPVFSASDDNILLDKLREAIRGHEFNLGVFLGTQHQTFSMITDTAFRVRQGLNALLRRGRLRDIIKALNTGKVDVRSGFNVNSLDHRDLSSRWLEASYGWLPLLSDLDNGARALATATDHYYSKEYRVRRRVTSFDVQVSSPSICTAEGNAYIRKQIIYRVNPMDSFESQLVLLGLKEPYSLAWELFPWSFVCDWAIPIGSFLDNLAFFPHLKGDWVKTTSTYSTVSHKLKPSASWSQISPQKTLEVTVSRTVGSGSLAVPLPSFTNPFNGSWRRAANAVALLLQRAP